MRASVVVVQEFIADHDVVFGRVFEPHLSRKGAVLELFISRNPNDFPFLDDFFLAAPVFKEPNFRANGPFATALLAFKDLG